MRGAHSISTRRAYGLQRICRVWHCARSSVYARRQATTSQVPCRRRGPVGAAGLTIPLTLVAWMAVALVSAWGFDPGVVDLIHGYLRVVTWSLLPLLLFTVFRRYVQAVGIVRPIMLTLISANIINAAANWLLVFGNLGFPQLGVEGAAWATCVSRTYMLRAPRVLGLARQRAPAPRRLGSCHHTG